MKILKKILFLNIILALFILSSCGKKTTSVKIERTSIQITPNVIFCANAVYDSKEDIPEVVFSICCYDEVFTDDVGLNIGIYKAKKYNFGPDYDDYEILYDDNTEIGKLKTDKNNKYYLYLNDKDNNKTLVQQIHPSDGVFSYGYTKCILNCWFLGTDRIYIPMEYFDKEEGEFNLTAYHLNVTTSEEKSLASVTIKYTKDEEGIKLIAPEKSFSGKGLLEGKTQEEIYQEV